MLSAKVICNKPSVRQFTIARHIEADGKCLNRLTCQLAHRSCNNTGVNTPTQHCSYGYVGNHAFLDSASHMLANTLQIFLDGPPLGLSKLEVPVAFLVHLPIFKQKPMPWQNFVDIGEECCWPGNIAHTEKIGQGLDIDPPSDFGMIQQ